MALTCKDDKTSIKAEVLENKEMYEEILMDFLEGVPFMSSSGSRFPRKSLEITYDYKTHTLIQLKSLDPGRMILRAKIDFGRVTNKNILEAYDAYARKQTIPREKTKKSLLFQSLLDYVYTRIKGKLLRAHKSYVQSSVLGEVPSDGLFIPQDFPSHMWIELLVNLIAMERAGIANEETTNNMVRFISDLLLNPDVNLLEMRSNVVCIMRDYSIFFSRGVSESLSKELCGQLLLKIFESAEQSAEFDDGILFIEDIIREWLTYKNPMHVRANYLSKEVRDEILERYRVLGKTVDPKMLGAFTDQQALYQISLKTFLKDRTPNLNQHTLFVVDPDNSPVDYIKLLAYFKFRDKDSRYLELINHSGVFFSKRDIVFAPEIEKNLTHFIDILDRHYDNTDSNDYTAILESIRESTQELSEEDYNISFIL